MNYLISLMLIFMSATVFSAESTPLHTMRRHASNVLRKCDRALNGGAEPAQKIIGVGMALGGVYAVAKKNRNIQGLLLIAGGTILATGNVQNTVDFIEMKYNECVYFSRNSQKRKH